MGGGGDCMIEDANDTPGQEQLPRTSQCSRVSPPAVHSSRR